MEGKPPLALWFSHTGIIAYPPLCIQYLFSTPNTPLYSEIVGGVLTYNPDTGYFGIQYNGKWNDVLFAGLESYWLYNKGNEFIARSGGWNNPDGGATKYSDHITMISPAVTNACSTVQTVNLVDLTNFDKLSIDFNCISPNAYATYEIGIVSESGIFTQLRYTYGGGGWNRNTLTLDIARYKEKYKVQIRAVTGSNYASTVNVYSVLLS